MANYQLIKADIDAKVYQNGQQEITGENLNSVLNAMVTTLGAEYQFAGVATTTTNPGTPDAKVFYIANGKGTYTNFGSLEVTEDDVVVLTWDSSWHKVSTGIASNEKLTELVNQTYGELFFKRSFNFAQSPKNMWIEGYTVGDDVAIVIEPVTDISQLDVSFTLSYKTYRIFLVGTLPINNRFYFQIPDNTTELIITRTGTSPVDIICNVYAYKGGIDISKEIEIQNIEKNSLGIMPQCIFDSEALGILSDFNDAEENNIYSMILTTGNIPLNAPSDIPLNTQLELKTIKTTYNNYTWYLLYQTIHAVLDDTSVIDYYRIYNSRYETWDEWHKESNKQINNLLGITICNTSYNFGKTSKNFYISDYIPDNYFAIKIHSNQDLESLGANFSLSYKKSNIYPPLEILSNNEWVYVKLPNDASDFIITKSGDTVDDVIVDIEVIQGGYLNEIKFNEHKVFHVGSTFKYKTLRNAVEIAKNYYGSEVIVHPGIYDLANEFAPNISDNRDGVFYGIGLSNDIKLRFMTGTMVTAKIPANATTQMHFQPFYTLGNCEIDGLNIEVENTRYCIHDDTGGEPIIKFKNCNMKNKSVSIQGSHSQLSCFPQCIGGGFGTNKNVVIDNCVFYSEIDGSTDVPAVSYHNGFSEIDEGKVIVSNSYFNGKNFLRFGWHGPSTIISKCVANNNSFGNTLVIGYETPDSKIQNIEVLEYLNEVRTS